MKKTLKKCLFAALAFAVSLAPSVFAQDASEWAEIPFINVKNVKHTVVPVQGYTGKWACTTVELKAEASKWQSKFKMNDWINNLKVTLTLAYPKTATSFSGVKARGTQEERAGALKDAEEAVGANSDAKYTYYRAAVTLVGLQVGSGGSSFVSFYIPSEIVDRESKLSNAMSGQAKPEFYLVEFSYKGNALPVCDPKGGLLSSKALGFNGARPSNMKSPADFVKWLHDNADGSVGDTKGLLIPYVNLPYVNWPKNAPAVIFENIEQ